VASYDGLSPNYWQDGPLFEFVCALFCLLGDVANELLCLSVCLSLCGEFLVGYLSKTIRHRVEQWRTDFTDVWTCLRYFFLVSVFFV